MSEAACEPHSVLIRGKIEPSICRLAMNHLGVSAKLTAGSGKRHPGLPPIVPLGVMRHACEPL